MVYRRQFHGHNIQEPFSKGHPGKAMSKTILKFSHIAIASTISKETNMLIRLKSTLAKAIEKRMRLPRFIVVVLDNDLIQYLAYMNKGMATLVGEFFEVIVTFTNDLIEKRKKILPSKAMKADHPQVYFVASPRHHYFSDNEARKILQNCMEATVKVPTFNNIRMVRIVDIWDFKDDELVNDQGQLTSLGLSTYWASVDAAITFNVCKRDDYLSKRGALKNKSKSGGAANISSRKSNQFDATKEDNEDIMIKFFKRSRNRKRVASQDQDQEQTIRHF